VAKVGIVDRTEEPMATTDELLDDLMKNYKKPEDLIGENGLLKQLTKALIERAMKVELTDHLGYPKHDPAGENSGNSRNGNSKKTIKGEFGNLCFQLFRYPYELNEPFPGVIHLGKPAQDVPVL